MSVQIKTILGLILSCVINIVLVVIMLQPPEVQDNSILYSQIDASKKIILSQQEKIVDLSNRLDTFTVIQDSLQTRLDSKPIELKEKNKAVYEIPSSSINDQ
mgnify:FL=1